MKWMPVDIKQINLANVTDVVQLHIYSLQGSAETERDLREGGF